MAQKSNENDDSALWLVIAVGLIFLSCFLIGHFHSELNYFIARFKIVETWPARLWSNDWLLLERDILNNPASLSGISTFNILNFYNMHAAIIWLAFFIPAIFYVWKKKTVDIHAHFFDPQGLIDQSSLHYTDLIPWVKRDVTKYCWNLGKFRLMESPLLFLVRQRCLKDPNGDFFRLNLVFSDCGDTDELYYDKDSVEQKRDIFTESSFEKVISLCNDNIGRNSEKETFVKPKRRSSHAEAEIEKFRKCGLVPNPKSCYLNSRYKKVLNSLDEQKLSLVLEKQLGDRIKGNPFEYLRQKGLKNKKYQWLYGVACAFYLHGILKKNEAEKIFDAMNISLAGDGPIRGETIDIGPAKDLLIDYEDNEIFMDTVISIHTNYLNVFFMDLLNYARKMGVLEGSRFNWIRPLDRSLWYSLVQAGGATCSAEAAGVWSHYKAEEVLGKSLENPYLWIAIDGFREEMVNEGWLNKDKENENIVARKNRLEELRKRNENYQRGTE